MAANASLQDLVDEASILASSASVLGWDQETYLPKGSSDWRARQLSWLSGRHHEKTTSPEWRAAIEASIAETAPDDTRRLAGLREMLRHFDRNSRLTTELVERQASLRSRAKHVWADARKAGDFPRFAPLLEQLVDLSREKADRYGYEDEPYDALLECYERGATTRQVAAIFADLKPRLREITSAAVARSEAQSAALPSGPYPVEAQMTLNRRVAESIGFDFTRGRIDTTTHPFCTTLGPQDVRLTTRYDESDFTSSLFGVLHEAGHGLYEQGLLPEDFGTPAGDAASLGIHESQSRLWENHVGRSRRFWEQWFPVACDFFPQLTSLGLDAFMRFVQRSEISFIRVEADEATYDSHIILRFELERRLVRGDLAVKDVPAAWNEAFHEAFGKTPPGDRQGCLQDIHWAMGGIGYFPTYTLGNLNAAQLFATAQKDPSIRSAIANVDYRPLLGWLRETIHHPGATLTPSELIERATGKPPGAEAHITHLERRYTEASLT